MFRYRLCRRSGEADTRARPQLDDERAADGAIVDISLEVKDKRQLERVVSSVRRIPGVRDIERVNP